MVEKANTSLWVLEMYKFWKDVQHQELSWDCYGITPQEVSWDCYGITPWKRLSCQWCTVSGRSYDHTKDSKNDFEGREDLPHDTAALAQQTGFKVDEDNLQELLDSQWQNFLPKHNDKLMAYQVKQTILMFVRCLWRNWWDSTLFWDGYGGCVCQGSQHAIQFHGKC